MLGVYNQFDRRHKSFFYGKVRRGLKVLGSNRASSIQPMENTAPDIAKQPWARYLEGDKIPTKIGSGQDRNGLPDFLTNRDRDRDGLPDFLKFRGNSGKVGIGLHLSLIALIYPNLP